MIQNIAEIINETLKTNAFNDIRFAGAKYFGLSSLYSIENEVSPFVVDDYGQAIYCGFDDIAPLIIYHRTISSQNILQRAKAVINDKLISQQFTISLIVTAHRNKIKLIAEEIDMLIASAWQSSLPHQKLIDFNLRGCNLIYVSTNYNTTALLQREYTGKNIINEPNLILFELRYNVELTYNSGCLEILCCNN